MSELPTQLKGNKFCVDHLKEEIQLVCRDCNETLVCLHCISTTHIGHTFVAISLLVQEKFNYLQDLVTSTEKTRIPKLFQNS